MFKRGDTVKDLKANRIGMYCEGGDEGLAHVHFPGDVVKHWSEVKYLQLVAPAPAPYAARKDDGTTWTCYGPIHPEVSGTVSLKADGDEEYTLALASEVNPLYEPGYQLEDVRDHRVYRFDSYGEGDKRIHWLKDSTTGKLHAALSKHLTLITTPRVPETSNV